MTAVAMRAPGCFEVVTAMMTPARFAEMGDRLNTHNGQREAIQHRW
jgi:hypothetical protein